MAKITQNKLGNYVIEGYSRQFKTLGEAKAKAKELEKSNTTTKNNGNSNSSSSNKSSSSSSNNSSNSKTNTSLNQNEEDFWNEWTKLQQFIADNPQEMQKLMDEISIFDPHYSTLTENLNKERQLNLSQINKDYQDTINKIDLDNTFNEQQKTEAIKGATDSFVSTYQELNFSEDLAYKNASKTIKNAIEDTGNMSAQSYVKQISNGVIGGNINQINADQIVRSLKEYRQDTQDDLESRTMDIEFQKRKQLKQLESQVGSDQAQGIFNQAQNLYPQNLYNPNAYKELSQVNKNNQNTANQYSYGNYTGSINQNFQRQQSFNDLSKQSALSSKNQQIDKLNFGYDKSSYDINQSKKTDKLNYLQNQMPYIPYLQTNSGSFLIGNQAKQSGGQSATQRNKWKNQLGLGTFRVY